MDDELKPTLFDEQLQSKELQILKTSIPYLQEPQQKNLAIFAKILELQKTIHFFENDSSSLNICSMENPEENVVNMLNDIRPYCNEKEAENLDSFINMFHTVNLITGCAGCRIIPDRFKNSSHIAAESTNNGRCRKRDYCVWLS